MANMRLKSVSVLGVAAWHSFYTLIFAILLGVVYSGYLSIAYGRIPASYAVYYIVVTPIAYCVFGFIAYGFTALIYNNIARHSGGISLEIETTDNLPPAPPTF
jgi:hypothetical protein